MRRKKSARFKTGFQRHDSYARGTTLLGDGLVTMDTSAQYREFAEQCRLLAAQAKSERHRRMLEEMADAWIKLAQETKAQN